MVEGALSWDDFAGQLRLSADNLMRIGEARARFAKRLQIRWTEASLAWVTTLKATLEPYRGGECPVFIERHLDSARAVVQLGEPWRVLPKEALLNALSEEYGEESVRLRFD